LYSHLEAIKIYNTTRLINFMILIRRPKILHCTFDEPRFVRFSFLVFLLKKIIVNVAAADVPTQIGNITVGKCTTRWAPTCHKANILCAAGLSCNISCTKLCIASCGFLSKSVVPLKQVATKEARSPHVQLQASSSLFSKYSRGVQCLQLNHGLDVQRKYRE
jgi:hypothetical protein